MERQARLSCQVFNKMVAKLQIPHLIDILFKIEGTCKLCGHYLGKKQLLNYIELYDAI